MYKITAEYRNHGALVSELGSVESTVRLVTGSLERGAERVTVVRADGTVEDERGGVYKGPPEPPEDGTLAEVKEILREHLKKLAAAAKTADGPAQLQEITEAIIGTAHALRNFC